jgi:hypothetical protein
MVSYYNLVNITPLHELTQGIMNCLGHAASIAEKSVFVGSKRLGAFLEYKKYHFYTEKTNIVPKG